MYRSSRYWPSNTILNLFKVRKYPTSQRYHFPSRNMSHRYLKDNRRNAVASMSIAFHLNVRYCGKSKQCYSSSRKILYPCLKDQYPCLSHEWLELGPQVRDSICHTMQGRPRRCCDKFKTIAALPILKCYKMLYI